MYTFKQATVGPLLVHLSFPRQGAVHLKQFTDEVTAQTQNTLNVYVQGQFRFTVDGVVDQVLSAGQTSLDIPGTFPANSLAVEEVLSNYGVRYCINNSTQREIVDVSQAMPVTDRVLFVLDGEIYFNERRMTRGAYLHIPSGEISGQGRVLLVR